MITTVTVEELVKKLQAAEKAISLILFGMVYL